MQFFRHPELNTKYSENVSRLKGSTFEITPTSLSFLFVSTLTKTNKADSSWKLGLRRAILHTRRSFYGLVHTINDKIQIKYTCLHLARDLTRFVRLKSFILRFTF